MTVRVTVRDGRVGRDPRFAAEGGEILRVEEADMPYAEGDRLSLTDGEEVVVIGYRERISEDGWEQTVFVGNV